MMAVAALVDITTVSSNEESEGSFTPQVVLDDLIQNTGFCGS